MDQLHSSHYLHPGGKGCPSNISLTLLRPGFVTDTERWLWRCHPPGYWRWYAPSSRHLRSLLSEGGDSSCGRLWCCSCRVFVCVTCFSSYRHGNVRQHAAAAAATMDQLHPSHPLDPGGISYEHTSLIPLLNGVLIYVTDTEMCHNTLGQFS